MSGVLAPAQEIRAWRLTLTPPQGAELATTYKDFVMTRFPCDVQRGMRDAVTGDSSAGNELTAIKDTTTKGCDDLSIITHTVGLKYRQIGDSLYVSPEGQEPLARGVWRGDTIVLVIPGERARTLIAVRDRGH